MQTKKIVFLSAILCLFMATASSHGQIVSTIDGLAYVDYYYNMNNHNASEKDKNAFQFRRIYFTFENELTPNIKIRFRLESASGQFGSTSKINPFVKHAYLEWANLVPNHKLYLGIAETNALKNAEGYWGYRSIEKTILDLENISPSADMGIALKGDLGSVAHHWLTIHNGPGYGSSEVDKYKKIGYAFWLTPIQGLMIEGYYDFEKQDPLTGTLKYAGDYFHSSGYSTLKGFIGYNASRFTLGAEAFVRTLKESGSSDAAGSSRVDVKRRGFSVFGSWITPVPKVKLFARFDSFDPNTDDDVYVSDSQNGVDDEHTRFFGGLDIIPKGNVHFMPNIVIKMYSQDGRDSDVTARITLYYQFDSGKITI